MLARELARVGVVAVDRPIGSSVAREVLTPRFDWKHTPSQARMAIDDLTKLHQERPLNSFCKTMDKLYDPTTTRKQQLSIHRLACDQVPLIRVRVESMVSLAHAEQFFELEFKREIDLCLQIRMPQSLMSTAAVDNSEEACEYLSQLAAVLEKIQSATSNVKMVMVELVFSAYVFDDDVVLRAASRVCTLALQDISVTTRFKVAVLVARSNRKRPLHSASLSAWGELLQCVCRIRSQDGNNEQTPREVIRYTVDGQVDDVDCNSLHVKFSQGSDTRLVAAFWSAVRFSRGYSSLRVDEFEAAQDLNIEDSQVRAKYAALALTSPHSSFCRISWLKSELTANELQGMQQVQASQSIEELATNLWYRPWNLSREGHVFQVETLNVEIVKAYGIVLNDPNSREWVDLLVPGFCQCSIKRNQLPQLSESRTTFRVDPNLQSLLFQVKANVPETVSALSGVFPIVGSSLTKLDLHTWDKPLKAMGLLAILGSCPRLVALTVTIKIPKWAVEFDPSQITCRSLKWLTIHYSGSSTEPRDHHIESFLRRILPEIGRQLEYVEIHGPSCSIKSPGLLSAITSSSPRLRSLNLHRLDVDSLQPVIEACREQHTTLTSLSFTQCSLDRSSFANFATFLAFSNVQKLRDFAFTFTRDDQLQPVIDKSVLLEFLGMLQANKTLLSLRISLGTYQHHLDQYRKHFQALNGEIMSVPGEPAPLETTLALLSALREKQLTQDPDIVQMILGFAAARAKRAVILDIDE